MIDRGRPESQDSALVRSAGITRLIDQVVLSDSPTEFISDGVQSGPYRRFTLYLRIKSSGAPTTVQFVVEFLEEASGIWHTHKQGLFAALFYEDADTATEVDEVFEGLCAGRAIRVRAVGVGTDADNTFTVSAAVEFFN